MRLAKEGCEKNGNLIQLMTKHKDVIARLKDLVNDVSSSSTYKKSEREFMKVLVRTKRHIVPSYYCSSTYKKSEREFMKVLLPTKSSLN